MNLNASLRTALRALRKNKLRSLLAMLGIVIAVGAVVATVAIGQGAQAKVAQQMDIEPIAAKRLTFRHGSRALRIAERVRERPREACTVCVCEPVIEAVASTGAGVFDTLKAVAKQVLTELRKG